MTTSRTAAATQVGARVTPAMHLKVFMPDAFHATSIPISVLQDWLRICWLAYLE